MTRDPVISRKREEHSLISAYKTFSFPMWACYFSRNISKHLTFVKDMSNIYFHSRIQFWIWKKTQNLIFTNTSSKQTFCLQIKNGYILINMKDWKKLMYSAWRSDTAAKNLTNPDPIYCSGSRQMVCWQMVCRQNSHLFSLIFRIGYILSD